MTSIPNLLTLPSELREMILKFANVPIIHPRPIIPVEKNNGIIHDEGTDWRVREVGWTIKYFRAGGTVDYHPTLAVNHQLSVETLEILHKNQKQSIYDIDLILVNDSELWVTWLSTPIIVDKVKGIDIQFRNAGFVDGKRDIDQNRRALLWSEDNNSRFRHALSNIILEILGRRPNGHYKDAARKLRLDTLTVFVYYTADQHHAASRPMQSFDLLKMLRDMRAPVEVYMHEMDILEPLLEHMDCRLGPEDFLHEEHPVTSAIYESIDHIDVSCYVDSGGPDGPDDLYDTGGLTFDVGISFRLLQYDNRWYYHPFFPEEVFKAWKASTQLIRWNM